jgi:uncharacterized protein (TIGR03905 family)
MFSYLTKGTCSTRIQFSLQDNKVHSVTFEGGCNGNLKALGVLVEGMDADILIKKLKGLQCGQKKTSCADQLATAVAQAIEKSK